MKQIRLSEKYKLQIGDFLRGAGLAIAAPVLLEIQKVLDSGSFELDWAKLGSLAGSVFIAYLVKNWLFEPPKVISEYENNENAKQVANDIKARQ